MLPNSASIKPFRRKLLNCSHCNSDRIGHDQANEAVNTAPTNSAPGFILYRFASLNLLNFAEPPAACYEWDNIYSHAAWQCKTAWLARVLQQQQPDLLAVQEVFSVEALRALTAPLGYQLVVAGQPLLREEHIFEQPVVGLLSRYPIADIEILSADPQAVSQLGLVSFQFSRPPLAATVFLPGLGPLRVVVVHLKSRRPTDLADPLLARWQAQQQRGLEAVLLRQLLPAQAKGKPLLVAGDLNDELSSALLAPLLAKDLQTTPALVLQDSAILAPVGPRPATHYYGAVGKVLDYLLLSADFDPKYPHSLAAVTDYQVADDHLVRPQFALDGHSSDHAMVQVTVQLRR